MNITVLPTVMCGNSQPANGVGKHFQFKQTQSTCEVYSCKPVNTAPLYKVLCCKSEFIDISLSLFSPLTSLLRWLSLEAAVTRTLRMSSNCARCLEGMGLWRHDPVSRGRVFTCGVFKPRLNAAAQDLHFTVFSWEVYLKKHRPRVCSSLFQRIKHNEEK